MHISEFTGCCGAKILSSFGDEWFEGKKRSEAHIGRQSTNIRTCIGRITSRGLVFATLNQHQIRAGWGDALMGAGFKKAGQLAANGGNDIQGYVYNVVPSNAILAKQRKAGAKTGRFAR
jgi:hypothetical protein